MAAGTPHLWQVQLVPPVDDGVRRARLAEQPRHWWAFCATILALSRFEGDPETWNFLLGFHGPGSMHHLDLVGMVGSSNNWATLAVKKTLGQVPDEYLERRFGKKWIWFFFYLEYFGDQGYQGSK